MIGNKTKIRQNKNGTYTYQLRYMRDGKLHRKTIHAATDREADRQLQKFVADVDAGIIDWAKITWPDLCTQWLEKYSRVEHKQSTYESNVRKIDKRIKSAWSKPASEITRMDVQEFITSTCETEHLSPKTARNLLSLISAIFAWGVRMNLITSSPCEYIVLPRREQKEANHLTEDELFEILDLLEEEPLKYKTAIYTLVFTGMRKGELLGLYTEDIDMETGAYTVKRNRQSQRGGGSYIDTPKTKSGERTGHMPEVALDVISEYMQEQEGHKAALKDAYKGTPYLITHEDGSPVSPQALSDWLLRLRKKYPDAPRFSLHTLRHTHASMLRALGGSMDEIQKRLGHASKSTTQKIYVHLFEDPDAADKKLTQKIDEHMQKKKGLL